MKLTPLLSCGLAALLAAACAPTPGPLDYVDPTIGGVGVLLQPTRPTVQIPGEVIRWSPRRADLLDDCITDFPLTLTSHRLESVFGFLPVCGQKDNLWSYRQVYDNEHTTPYEYSSVLEGCSISFTASKKSGIALVSFEDEGDRLLRFSTINQGGGYELLSPTEIAGQAGFGGMRAYVYIVTDTPVEMFSSAGGGRDIAVKASADRIAIRYAISYVSPEQARVNLDNEIPAFTYDKVRAQAKAAWERTLGRIEVTGGTDEQKRIFYTALYRCSERMIDINEYGSYYSAFDHAVHRSDKPFYTDNWMWDTHISLEPLQTILDPEREEQKLQSYVEMYRQGGTMPSFAVITGDWPAMTGNYAAVWMADCWAKGLHGFDLETAYEGCRANSLDATLLPWRNGPRTVLDDFYNEHGWYPALHPGEPETVPEVNLPWERRQAVSLSTAFSYADWATGKLAGYLGRTEDAELFARRAQFYRNVYRPEKGMFWPRDINGEWIDGVDPRYMDRAYYTENNAYTFQWDVKHDLYGLFDLMGGTAEAEKKLDELFRIQIDMAKFQFYTILPDATGMVGQFAMGNEPSFHIPYIYDYLGSPWKTQKKVHQLIDLLFADTPLGVPGDEDGGGMSSFVVFTMMGFFPVTPGIPVYAIGSPFFETATINLPDGKKFTVKAVNYNPDNKYIQSARLNGEPLERCWFTHDELTQGGTLELTMGDRPAKDWATNGVRL